MDEILNLKNILYINKETDRKLKRIYSRLKNPHPISQKALVKLNEKINDLIRIQLSILHNLEEMK
jgi:hypothetical protein